MAVKNLSRILDDFTCTYLDQITQQAGEPIEVTYHLAPKTVMVECSDDEPDEDDMVTMHEQDCLSIVLHVRWQDAQEVYVVRADMPLSLVYGGGTGPLREALDGMWERVSFAHLAGGVEMNTTLTKIAQGELPD